jgi:N-acetylneuraminate lyase
MNTHNQQHLRGLVAATHTPFHPNGALNSGVVEKQAEHLLKHNLTTAFISGSTGESHSLSLTERRQLAQRWHEVGRGTSLRLIVHVGSNCLEDAKALAAQASELGVLAISALAPSYFKPPTLAALVQWCAEIAAAAPDTPFYFYDIPALTHTSFSMPAFLAEAPERIPNLRGIKFTNYDLMAYQLCLRADDGAFDIPWGVDEFLLGALALGGRSAVGSSYNLAAPLYQRLLAAFDRGDFATARQEQFRSVQLIRLLAGYGYLGAAKAVMKMLGVDVGPARLPNANPTPEQVVKLQGELEELGFFEWIGAAKPQTAASR